MTDFALGTTFDLKFTTRRFSTGAPFTLAGTPVISAYPDNSTTQLTAGITLSVDFDGVTGLHNIRVVATSGNGYAAGSSYALVITTGTVDSVSVVGEVVGHFTIERSAAFGRLGAPAGASVSADIAGVQSDTNDIQTRLPAALVSGRMDSSLEAAGLAADAGTEIATGVWAAATRTLTVTEGIKKNTAFSNFEFYLVSSTDNVTPKTGVADGSFTKQVSIDGAAFVALSGAIVEVSNGIYKLSLTAAELNGDLITLRFAATGALDTIITFKTSP